MKQAIDILEHLSSDAAVRRRAADREARLRFDEMVRRDELQEVRTAALVEGRAEGVVLGRAEGRAEGEALARTMLLGTLALRFGALAPEHRSIVEAASRDQLHRWAAHALVAPTLHELLAL